MSEADRCSNGIRCILGGVQCGTFIETEEAECPFAEISFLCSEGLRRYGERLIDCRSRNGDNCRFPWQEVDLCRPAHLCRLLQVKEEIAMTVADEPVGVTRFSEHVTMVGKTCIFCIHRAPKACTPLGHHHRNLFADEYVKTEAKP